MDRNPTLTSDPRAAPSEPPDIGAVFADHRMGLLRLAVLLVGDRATAEDVVQDAFAGLQRRSGELRTAQSALPYVRAAVVNGCRMVQRRRSLLRRIGITPQPPIWTVESAEATTILREDRREVIEALQRLPRRRREVLILRFYLDLPDAEIAQVMGIGEATVRSTAARAIAALGRILEEGS